MGSGVVMNSYVMEAMKTLKPEEVKKTLECLGKDFLVDLFGDKTYEDFETRNRTCAELVAEAVKRDFTKRYGAEYPFSVDVVKEGEKFKVAYFK
jgi:hypothetical protein